MMPTLSTQEVSIMPNTLELKGNWNKVKGLLKQKYAALTDDDLLYVEGKEDELLGRLQEKTGQTREALKKEFDEFLK